MKRTVKSFLATISLVFIAAGNSAQQNQRYDTQKSPGWVSEKGYWVVQSNKHTPRQHTVFFYDKENRLIQQQDIKDEKLNPEKRKTKIRLKKALEAALAGSQNRGEPDLPLTTTILN